MPFGCRVYQTTNTLSKIRRNSNKKIERDSKSSDDDDDEENV